MSEEFQRYHYSNPDDESDPSKDPDIEVWSSINGDWYWTFMEGDHNSSMGTYETGEAALHGALGAFLDPDAFIARLNEMSEATS